MKARVTRRPGAPAAGATGAPAAGAGRGTDGPRRDGRKIYARRRAGGTYYYGDLRAYADVGGRLEALVAPGAKAATQDFAEAARLYAAREATYRAARAARASGACVGALPGVPAPSAPPRLGPFLSDHLEWKAGRPHVRDGTIDRDESSAKVLLRVLGNMPLPEVTPARLEDYVAQRLAEPGVRRGTTTAARTVRAELHCLSHAMRRAVVLGHVAANPVRLMMSKPALPAAEAAFLTDAEAARLLAAARDEDAATALLVAERRAGARARGRAGERTPEHATGAVGDAVASSEAGVPARAPGDGWHAPSMEDQVPFAHAVVATYLYTGGRADEVLGLLVGDVDFARARVHLRHNRWRRLKREHHQRAVQLWPALAEVLGPHLDYLATLGPGALEPEALLFPSPKTGRPLDRFGKPLDRILRRAGLVPPATPRVTPHTLRHTFATALLQTLVPAADGGWAVRSSFDVAKQLGHRSSKLVDDTYGHAVADPAYRRDLRYGRAGGGRPGVALDGSQPQSGLPTVETALETDLETADVLRGAPAAGDTAGGDPSGAPTASAPSPLLWFVAQRGGGDCGVAALAMLLELPYDVVHRACAAVPGLRPGRGTSARQLARAAGELGRVVRRRPAGAYALRRSCGVLGVDLAAGGHWVFLSGGIVYDGRGTVWHVAEYLTAHGAAAAELLVCAE